MGLIEGIVGKRHQGLPEHLHRLLAVAVGYHPALEVGELLIQLALLLLAHRAPQHIGLAQRKPRHLLRDRHHLLLVDDEPERGTEDVAQRFFELGVDGIDRL